MEISRRRFRPWLHRSDSTALKRLKRFFRSTFTFLCSETVPQSSGCNVFSQEIRSEENAYAFPPFALIVPLLSWVWLCPAILAAGTGDNIFGKLCSLFSEIGKGGDWNDSSGTGNPASHYVVRQYLLHLREEQAKARVSRKQAVLFFNKL